MKRLVSLILLLLLLCFACCSCSNMQDGSSLEDFDYQSSYGETGFTATITGYKGSARHLVVPDEINDLAVTKIDSKAFWLKTSLRSVVVPASVKQIGDWAFGCCRNLKQVVLSFGVETIGEGAFSDCYALKEIDISDSVTTIKGMAFFGCEKLTAISLPHSISIIEDAAFFGCEELTEIVWPEGVWSVEQQMFEGCAKLKKVSLPETVTNIGSRAFYGCSALTQLKVPPNVKSIAFDAFENCSSDLLLYVGAGTYAEQFCISNGLKYQCYEVTSAKRPASLEEKKANALEMLNVDWNKPSKTIWSQGATNPRNGTCVDAELFGKVLQVNDRVGGWFYFVAPETGDYFFSVLAPDLSRSSFSIEVYKMDSGKTKRISSLVYNCSEQVQVQAVENVKKGEVIYWWDSDGSGRGYTLTEPFSLVITYQERKE